MLQPQRTDNDTPAIYRQDDTFPIPGFPLTAMCLQHPGAFPEHCHEFIEVVFILRGSGKHHCRTSDGISAAFDLAVGDVFAIHPDISHSFSMCKNLWVYNLLFTMEMIATAPEELSNLPAVNELLFSLSPSSEPLHLPVRTQRPAIEQLNRIISELTSRKPGFQFAARTALFELLLTLGRMSNSTDSKVFNARHQQAIANATNWLEKHFAEPMTLEMLAREAGMSKYCFCHSFKTLYGFTPWSYLTQLRIEKAKTMLLSTDFSIQEIAFQTGLCDGRYLTKIFKRLEQITPLQFRQRWTRYGHRANR